MLSSCANLKSIRGGWGDNSGETEASGVDVERLDGGTDGRNDNGDVRERGKCEGGR